MKRSIFAFLIVLILTLLVLGCIDKKGTYSNPAEIGEVVTLSAPSDTLEVSVIEVVRGKNANSAVAALNVSHIQNTLYNEMRLGYEYCCIEVQLENVGDNPTWISNVFFTAYPDNVINKMNYVFLQDYQEFETGYIMPDEIVTGWLIYLVPQNQEVIISYQLDMFNSIRTYINIG